MKKSKKTKTKNENKKYSLFAAAEVPCLLDVLGQVFVSIETLTTTLKSALVFLLIK